MSIEGKRIREVRIALGGVATKPWRAKAVESELVGKVASEEVFLRAAAAGFEEARAYSQNAFKIPLGQQAIVRNLRDLIA